MFTRHIQLEALDRTTIDLGHAGEKNRTEIRFDCSRIYAEIPGAAAALTVRSPAGETYPVATTIDGDTLVWLVSASDTAWTGQGDGYGKVQLTFSDGDQVAKTYEGRTVVHESLGTPGPAPSGVQTWLEQANLALSELPIEIQRALQEAKESGEFDGVGIANIEKTGTVGLVDTYTITMTDGTPYTFTVTNGRDGQKGQDGQDGADAYVWIRYAAAQPAADADMKTTPDAWIGIYSGDAATAPEHYTDYAWYKIKGEPGPVQDVQINGISILQSGIAKIPKASSNAVGALKTNAWYGTAMDNDTLYINGASANDEKSGTQEYKPVTPSSQHISAFYGLAKVAGADMKNSSNPVGTFTDAAKVAIQKMLGIYEAPWELINEVTVAADSTEIKITTDAYGEPFKLTSLIAIFTAGASTTGARDNFYVNSVMKKKNVETTVSLASPSLTYPTATSTMFAKIELNVNPNAPITGRTVVATSVGNTQNLQAMPRDELIEWVETLRIYQSADNKSLIPEGSTLKLYGKRLVE